MSSEDSASCLSASSPTSLHLVASLPSNLAYRKRTTSIAASSRLSLLGAAALHSFRALQAVLSHLLRTQPDELDFSPRVLFAAVVRDCARSVTALLGAGSVATTSGRNNCTGATPLHAAAARGHLHALRAILDFTPPRSTAAANDEGGLSAAHAAAACGRTDALKMLIKDDTAALIVRVVRFVALLPNRAPAELAPDEQTFGDVAEEYWERVAPYGITERSLLQKIPYVARLGATPLHFAAAGGHCDTIRAIVEAAAECERIGEYARVLGQYRPHTVEEYHECEEDADEEMSRVFSDWQDDFLRSRETSGKASSKSEHAHFVPTVEYCAHEALRVVIDDVECLTNDDPVYNHSIMSSISVHGVLNARRDDGSPPLLDAVRGGHIDAVRLLIELGADSRATDYEMQSAIHLAAKNSHTDIIDMFVKEVGLDVNLRDEDGWSPLHSASAEGSSISVEALLALGADQNAKTDLHETALLLAARFGHHDVFTSLLLAGSDPNVPDELDEPTSPAYALAQKGEFELLLLLLEYAQQKHIPLDLSRPVDTGLCILHHCVIGEHLASVRALLAAGAEPDVPDEHGWTPTLRASRDDLPDILQLLLEAGVDVNREKADGWRAIHLAAANRNRKCVRLLVEHGADVNADNWNGMFPLHLAAVEDDEEVVRILLEAGADRDRPRPNALSTPLHLAAFCGQSGPVSALLEVDADFRAVDSEGSTPLHVAASRSRHHIVRQLLDAGCPPDVRSCNGKTPLHLASGHIDGPEAVRVLIGRGADVKVVDENGNTPLHVAVIAGFELTARILLASGASICQQNSAGEDALLAASKAGQTESMCQLLRHGAKLDARDAKGRSALHLAAENGSAPVVKFLLRRGADVRAVDVEGAQPMHLAARAEQTKVVRLLVAHSGRRMTDFAPKSIYAVDSPCGSSSDLLDVSEEACRSEKHKECEKDASREYCRICLELLRKGEEVRVLPCQHTFHNECAISWLGEDMLRHFSCPLCRQPLYSSLAEDSKSEKEESSSSCPPT